MTELRHHLRAEHSWEQAFIDWHDDDDLIQQHAEAHARTITYPDLRIYRIANPHTHVEEIR